MEGVINQTASTVVGYYNNFIGFLPPYVGEFFNFLILVLLVVVYAVFIWKFYKFVSKKNIIGLNLNQYNRYEHPLGAKLMAGAFYLIEYIIILPFLIFFWFAVFTLLLIILSQAQEISQILVVSAVIIAAIRMTAYYKEGLSQDIAKMLPLTLLAVTVLNPNFYNESQYFERVISHLVQIPDFFMQIISYLIFIVSLEMVLRFFDFIISLFGLDEEEQIEEMKKKSKVIVDEDEK
ncbi:hypothetical protein BMS3Abin17_00378 [archaeon BMS3Abin17]|nr:hypothetical protein BMS3Abin17_00378 [archaeon BMS3Abin17]HDZ60243.1 hypothetical protein [Candidatus Pacearchaeota archaeon]